MKVANKGPTAYIYQLNIFKLLTAGYDFEISWLENVLSFLPFYIHLSEYTLYNIVTKNAKKHEMLKITLSKKIFSFLIIIIMSPNFNNINDILRVNYFIPYYCIYRNVMPQNLNSLLGLVVAKWTFAVWFHATLFRRFREAMRDMIGYYPSYFFVACWAVFTPLITAGIFFFKVLGAFI